MLPQDVPFNINICGWAGQRDFAAAVLLLHAAALAAAVLRQSAAVELATHVELLGITVIGSLKCARVLSCI
jgi:predicted membrane protein